MLTFTLLRNNYDELLGRSPAELGNQDLRHAASSHPGVVRVRHVIGESVIQRISMPIEPASVTILLAQPMGVGDIGPIHVGLPFKRCARFAAFAAYEPVKCKLPLPPSGN